MLQLLPPEDCRRLTDFFTQSGYTLESLSASRLVERASRRYGTLDSLLEHTASPSAFHTLARLFAIGVPVPEDLAAQQLPGWAVAAFLGSGMLRRNGNQLEPQVMLSPLGTMLIASDPVLMWEEDPNNLVLWPNPTTEQLFHFTVRKPFGSALDLGGGCGVQALGAASHCASVTATDLNSRAATFTSFNARLNGIENVECLTGDAFAPVAGRSFDLIVSNPPFFVTPGSALMYCENGLELDLFCRRIAREAPARLNEGGFFQMVCEWVEIEGQPWRDRISEWLDSSGCDAWVIHQYELNAFKYGTERGQQRPPVSDSQSRAFQADWMGYVHRNRIASVHGGLIAMRKRSGRNWVRIENEPAAVDASLGQCILSGFAARDLLDSIGDEALLELRPRLPQQARLNQMLEPSLNGWIARRLRLQLTGSRPRQIDIDPGVAQFIGHLNGSSRLCDAIQQIGAQAPGTPMDRLTQESVGIVRRLLAEGFLEI